MTCLTLMEVCCEYIINGPDSREIGKPQSLFWLGFLVPFKKTVGLSPGRHNFWFKPYNFLLEMMQVSFFLSTQSDSNLWIKIYKGFII